MISKQNSYRTVMMLISLIVFQLSIGVYSQEDYYDIQGYTTPGT